MQMRVEWLIVAGAFVLLSTLIAAIAGALRSTSTRLAILRDGRHIYLKRTLSADSAYLIDDWQAFRAAAARKTRAVGQALACIWLLTTIGHAIEWGLGNIPWMNTLVGTVNLLGAAASLFYFFRPMDTTSMAPCLPPPAERLVWQAYLQYKKPSSFKNGLVVAWLTAVTALVGVMPRPVSAYVVIVAFAAGLIAWPALLWGTTLLFMQRYVARHPSNFLASVRRIRVAVLAASIAASSLHFFFLFYLFAQAHE